MISTRDNPMAPRSQDTNLRSIKAQIHRRLLETMDLAAASRLAPAQLHAECSRRVNALIAEQRYPLTGAEQEQLLYEVMDDIFGLGPLEEFLRDPTVSDILVNGPDTVYVERHGRLELTDARFRDANHLMQVIQRVGANIGRRIDESCPMLDARLSDGSRVNAVIPPLALDGPCMSIRRFGTLTMDIQTLVGVGTLTDEMALLLEACVKSKINLLISGGTGAGKTTLLDVLAHWIPEGERVVTIEDAAELQLQRQHVVRLETRPPNIEGKGEVTQRELVRNALRMRPDRIIIGEVRGAETLDMLQAMNTGHEGSMSTVHANSPRDALRRIENMVSMAGLNYPVQTIREQLASALDMVVHIARLTGGQRKVTHIAEITGMEGQQFTLQDIFSFEQLGVDPQGRAAGRFIACGVRPQLLERIHSHGLTLPAEMFRHRVLSTTNGPRTDKTEVVHA
jgi:pilus assembly protein CpaF